MAFLVRNDGKNTIRVATDSRIQGSGLYLRVVGEFKTRVIYSVKMGDLKRMRETYIGDAEEQTLQSHEIQNCQETSGGV